MSTASLPAAQARHHVERCDVVDTVLCALTLLCGIGGYMILYPDLLSLLF